MLTLLLCISLIACNSPEGESAKVGEEQKVSEAKGESYVLDSSSVIHWAASKPTETHRGTFTLKEGTLQVDDNNLVAGNFVIDINSITNEDLTVDKGRDKLLGHLKSPDFFDVAKYPTASFSITSVQPFKADNTTEMKDATHTITGNLSLRDSVKSVTFPARITIDKKSLTAKADFNIDRTTWGMNYKGPGNPQDWFISKQVNLKLDLSATKK